MLLAGGRSALSSPTPRSFTIPQPGNANRSEVRFPAIGELGFRQRLISASMALDDPCRKLMLVLHLLLISLALIVSVPNLYGEFVRSQRTSILGIPSDIVTFFIPPILAFGLYFASMWRLGTFSCWDTGFRAFLILGVSIVLTVLTLQFALLLAFETYGT